MAQPVPIPPQGTRLRRPAAPIGARSDPTRAFLTRNNSLAAAVSLAALFLAALFLTGTAHAAPPALSPDRSHLSPDRTATLTAADPDATLERVASPSDSPSSPPKARTLTLPPGTWTVILRRPGARPVRGTLTLGAGQSQQLRAPKVPLPDRSAAEVWSIIGIGAGAAAVVTATWLELADIPESPRLSGAKLGLFGGGTLALFIGARVLGWIRTEDQHPSPIDAPFQLGAGPIPGGLILSGHGAF